MKRFSTLLFTLAYPFLVSAQMKVAILETVDKAQNVSYGIKLLLRSSLTTAISNTPGYDGYDRVDMASIAGEQEFQRTGNVSDNQIKQLGVATGAKYVLVAEAAKYDERSIIVTAKLLDVETFGVKSSAVVVSGIKADEMKKSCEDLASRLIDISQHAVGAPTSPATALGAAGPVVRRYEDFPEAAPGEIGSLMYYSDGSCGIIFYKQYGIGLAMSLDAVDLQWFTGRALDVDEIANNRNDEAVFYPRIGVELH